MGFKVIICAAHVKANNLSRDQVTIQNCFDKTTWSHKHIAKYLKKYRQTGN